MSRFICPGQLLTNLVVLPLLGGAVAWFILEGLLSTLPEQGNTAVFEKHLAVKQGKPVNQANPESSSTEREQPSPSPTSHPSPLTAPAPTPEAPAKAPAPCAFVPLAPPAL